MLKLASSCFRGPPWWLKRHFQTFPTLKPACTIDTIYACTNFPSPPRVLKWRLQTFMSLKQACTSFTAAPQRLKRPFRTTPVLRQGCTSFRRSPCVLKRHFQTFPAPRTLFEHSLCMQFMLTNCACVDKLQKTYTVDKTASTPFHGTETGRDDL